MVLKGWSTEKLKALLVSGVKNGYSPLASEQETGYWVLGLGALGDEGFNTKEIKPVEPTEKVKRSLLSSGDFLVSRSNTPDKVGRSIMYKGEIPYCSYPDLMMRFRINPESANPEFIEHKLKSSVIRKYFKNCAAGSSGSMVKINKGILEDTPIYLPPLPEQKKIAQILSTWDQAITATERLLENSRQRKKGLMQQLLTGKKRLPGFEGEFDDLPLSEAARITMGTSPKSAAYNSSGEGLPLLQGNADIEDRRSKPRVYTSEITKACQPGNILLSVRAPVGSVAISDHEACIGRGICAIQAKPGNDQAFLYQWMLWYEPRWASLSQGSTFESVNSADIRNLSVKVPKAAEQSAIAQVLSTGDQEITSLQNRLGCLKQEKKALMQQLLTGKRRVKAVEHA